MPDKKRAGINLPALGVGSKRPKHFLVLASVWPALTRHYSAVSKEPKNLLRPGKLGRQGHHANRA
jgi:hypothetical protein